MLKRVIIIIVLLYIRDFNAGMMWKICFPLVIDRIGINTFRKVKVAQRPIRFCVV